MSTLGSQRDRKLNRLLQAWPRGTVATQKWLTALGGYRQLAAKYVRHGWVERIGTGAYVRAGDIVDWRGALYALQSQLGMTVHVAGRSALELEGFAPFVPLGRRRRVVLVSDRPERLPSWFKSHDWGDDVEHHSLFLFSRVPDEATTPLDCGGFAVLMSSAERAVMEEMRLCEAGVASERALQLMEGLTTLRPKVVQRLLEGCTAVKVKRLFLWSAEAVGHAWFKQLDPSRVDLGVGKRQLHKGGAFDPKYRITVPRREEPPHV